MNIHRLLIGPAAVVLAAAATVTVGQGGLAAEPSAPIALRGPVPDGAESITVSLLPRMEKLSKGESAAIVPATTASVEMSGGKYAIGLEPEDVPDRFIGAGGLVDFEVDGLMPDGSVQSTEATARITRYAQSSSLFWTDPSTTIVPASTPNPGRGGRGGVGVLSARIEVEDDGSFVEDQYVSRTGGGDCSVDDTGQRRQVSTTIGTAYPFGGVATGWMEVSSSQGADYGLGASNDNATWYLNGSRFTQNGWGFNWSPDTRARSFRKDIEYAKYHTGCTVIVNGTTSYTNEWRWKPVSESSGGVSQNFDIARPNWTRCVDHAMAPGTWYRDNTSGNAYKYGGAVKFRDVIGIDLSIKRQYSSYQRLVYQIAGNNKTLCGNDALPGSAGKILMKRF